MILSKGKEDINTFSSLPSLPLFRLPPSSSFFPIFFRVGCHSERNSWGMAAREIQNPQFLGCAGVEKGLSQKWQNKKIAILKEIH
jgi:hypothetical protein